MRVRVWRKQFRKRSRAYLPGFEEPSSMTVEDFEDDEWGCPADKPADPAKPGGDAT